MTAVLTYDDVMLHGTTPIPATDGRLIYRFEGYLRKESPTAVFEDGIHFHNRFEAEVVAGPFKGGRISGLDLIVLRPDGVGLIVAPEVIEMQDTRVELDVHGYVVLPDHVQMPPFDVIASPGFDLPDVDFKVTGSALIRTADPRYAHLDRTVARLEGYLNMESGELVIEARSM